jgi:hypothetical protein
MCPLIQEGRIRFDTYDRHAWGYFSLLAPSFEQFAQREAGVTTIFEINVLFALGPDDLPECRRILLDWENRLSSYPDNWRARLEEAISGEQRVRKKIQPLLFRSRALAIVRKLLDLVRVATAARRTLLYGNGVAYRSLCGIPLPPGAVEYS